MDQNKRQHQADTLRSLDAKYKDITGEGMYLYMSEPGDTMGPRHNFHSGTITGFENAMAYMTDITERARKGRTHEAIVYDGTEGYGR